MSASDRNPQYFCPLRDEFINVAEADLLVVSSEAKADLPKPGEPVAQANITLHRAHEGESEEIEEICRYFWDETEFHCFGRDFNVLECVNILAVADSEIAGLLAYHKEDSVLSVVVINVFPEFQGQGIGRMLLREVMEQGRKQNCTAVRVATTNDDLPALCFYQKAGFRFSELLPGAVAEHHGDELNGFAGLPVLDEIRLERAL
jgi:ribosomal protein S18 acetylase RimI-like enzyme